MDWIEALLITVWVALATFLAGLRLAAESRRRSQTGTSPAWSALRLGLTRRGAPRRVEGAGPRATGSQPG